MFARFKTIEGKEVNVVAYKVAFMYENDTGTTIHMDDGTEILVQGSIRKNRSVFMKSTNSAPEVASEEAAPQEEA